MNVATRGRGADRAGAGPRDRTGRRPPGRFRSRGRWIVVVVLAALTAGVVVAFFTPLLGVRGVRVEGGSSVSPERVREVADVRPGTPMLRVDDGRIRANLAELPELAGTEVRLSWPSTVVLRVTQREPVAVAPVPAGVRLVDRAGVPFSPLPRAPAGLPVLRVPSVRDGDPALRSAVDVLGALPPQLRGQVREVVADRPNDVRLSLSDGRRVRWGGTAASERKAAVLPLLLSQSGEVYDVTSPELPTIRK